MSTLLGTPEERWPLSKAVDALGEAARRAGVPGAIWLAGLFYPSLHLSFDLAAGILGTIENATGILLPGPPGNAGALINSLAPSSFHFEAKSLGQLLAQTLFLLPLILLLYRLIAGLARVMDPYQWELSAQGSRRIEAYVGVIDPENPEASRRPLRQAGLKAVWRAGKGLGMVAFGLWAVLSLLLLGTMLFLIGPLVALVHLFGMDDLSPLVAGLVLPILALILFYAVVLQVLNQLALHSLAHNRRGVASALTHAWRLVRASPWSALRATLVDLTLFVTVSVVAASVHWLFARGELGEFLASAFTVCLYGFAGVTRAGYWARTYRALGGLSSADVVPGL